MEKEACMEKLLSLAQTILRLSSRPSLELSRDNYPLWDSLKHIELIFALEEAFGVSFTPEEMAELRSLAAIAERICTDAS